VKINVHAWPQPGGDVRVVVDCDGREATLLFGEEGVFAEIPQPPEEGP
jgi:hypothetical protein